MASLGHYDTNAKQVGPEVELGRPQGERSNPNGLKRIQ